MQNMGLTVSYVMIQNRKVVLLGKEIKIGYFEAKELLIFTWIQRGIQQ
jgi:hypothetical protein